MNNIRRSWSLLALLLCFVAVGAAADELDSLLDPVFATSYIDQVAISPDGKRVAWVRSLAAANDRYQHDVFVAALAGSSPERVAAPNGADQYGIAWSPDGKSLAMLRRQPDGGRVDLLVTDSNGHNARTLASLDGELTAPSWSHHGDRIALLQQTVSRHDADGPASLAGSGLRQQRVVAVAVNDGTLHPLTPPELYVYEYDWSPDDTRIAAVAAPARGEDEWWTAQLFVFDLDSSRHRAVYKPPLQIAYPKWSPDGRSIAVIGGLMSDFIAPAGELFLIDPLSGKSRDLTPGVKSSVTWLAWTSASRLLTGEIVDGEGAFAAIDVATGVRRPLWRGADAPFAAEVAFQPFGYSLSLASDGQTSAGIRSSFDRAPEVWAGKLGEWQQVSRHNDQARRSWGSAKSIHWMSAGSRVQGWLLYPRDYAPSNKYPLVTLVHGGPAGASLPHWAVPFDNVEILSQLGYFVFYPNPRGSTGLGEAFTRGNVRDFGYGDFRDIEQGVRQILRTLPVDAQRVGITGWSYGGYMAMWAITQTDLFHASVAGPGVSDWESYYGQVDMAQWVVPYFGASAYDAPAMYRRSSPMSFVKRARAATLMYVGAQDDVCPAPQSYELWRALRRMGVPTQLVVYDQEGHGIARPRNQRDLSKRTIRWFAQYLAKRPG